MAVDSFKTLQKIWGQVSQSGPDGTRKIFFKNRDDIVYLFCSGFVDESKFTVHGWIDAFQDSLQKDGSYQITEGQWMDKVRYHYSGPIGFPFDPMELREGDWSDEEIDQLIQQKIKPATYFTLEEVRGIFNDAKSSLYGNGRWRITREAKQDLQKVIEMYPSPAQVRGLGVLEARQAKTAPAPGAQPSTGYAAGLSPSLTAAQRLADILSKRKKP